MSIQNNGNKKTLNLQKEKSKKIKTIKALAGFLGTAASLQFIAAGAVAAKNLGKKIINNRDYQKEFDEILRNSSKLTPEAIKQYKDKNITEVNIPENVKEIDENTFRGFKNVKRVTITKSTGLIGKNAFSNMNSLEEIWIKDKSHIIGTSDLKPNVKIKYGEETYSIEEWKAKWNQENLTLEDSILSLSYDALKNLDKIKNVDTNKASSISTDAFSGLNLNSLTLNDELKNAKNNIFNELNIQKLLIGKALLANPIRMQLKKFSEINQVDILNTISEIPDDAFNGINIKNINLSSTITKIGKRAFLNSNITTIDLKNVLEILESAFEASKLKTVKFNSILNSIDKNAFAKCNFSELDMFDQVDSLHDLAFSETSVSHLKIGKLLEYKTINKVLTKLSSIENLTVKGNIEKIPSFSLAELNVNKLTLEEGVKEIEANALDFASINHLKIADSLEKLHYPSNPLSDTSGSFSNVKKIQTLEIGSALTKCNDLRELFFYGKNKEISRFTELKLTDSINSLSKDMWNSSIGNKIMNLNKITIPEKHTSLGIDTFKNVKFSNINLENITHLGEGNFYSCDDSLNLSLSDKLTTINARAFKDTNCFTKDKPLDLKNVTQIEESAFENSNISTLDLKLTKNIGKRAFFGSKIETVEGSQEIISLGESSFENASKLKYINNVNIQKIGAKAFKNCIELNKVSTLECDEIANEAFYNCTNLEHITLDNIKNIGNFAFYNTQSLETANLENVESLGEAAFQNSNLKEIDLKSLKNDTWVSAFENCKNLQKVDNFQNNNVRKIPNNAFKNCSSLIYINTINITSFGDYAFYQCTEFVSNDFTNVKEIGNFAFKSCKKIQNLQFPSELTSIGEEAFAECDLDAIRMPKTASFIHETAFKNATVKALGIGKLLEYQGINDILTNIKRIRSISVFGDIAKVPSLSLAKIDVEKLEFKEGVQELDRKALDQAKIKHLKICDSLSKLHYATRIAEDEDDDGSFSRVKKIEKLEIGKALTNCDDLRELFFYGESKKNNRFSNLTLTESIDQLNNNIWNASLNNKLISLNSITLPDKFTELGLKTFENVKFENINLDNITHLGERNFNSCDESLNLNLGENITTINARAFEEAKCFSEEKPIDLKNVTRIEEGAFRGSNISILNTKLTTYIGKEAFLSSEIKELNGANNLKDIDEYAFKYAERLTKIENDGNWNSIGKGAFYNCNSLREFKLKSSTITEIKDETFYGCSSLKSDGIDLSKITKIGHSAFKECINLTNIDLRNIEIIGDYAFYNCYYLKSLNKFNKDVEVGDSSFQGCTELSNVNIDKCKKLSRYSFSRCENLTNGIEKIKLHDDIIEIPANCFEGIQQINKLELNINNVKKIGDSAFNNAKMVHILNPKKTLTHVGYEAFKDTSGVDIDFEILENIGSSAFKNTNLNKKDIVFKNLKTMGDYVFENNQNINSVDFSKTNIKKIPNNTFKDCKSLTNVKLNNKIEEIGSGAFENCASLENLDLSKIKKIDRFAFRNCDKFTEINLANIEELEEFAFADCSSLKKVNLPSKLKKINRYTFAECISLEEINLNNIEVIEQRAFIKTKLKYCNFSSLVELGDSAFADCNFPSTFNLKFYKDTKIDNYAFANSTFSGFPYIDFNYKQVEIGDSAFSGIKGITSLINTQNVKEVQRFAFYKSSLSGLGFNPRSIFPNAQLGDHIFAD